MSLAARNRNAIDNPEAAYRELRKTYSSRAEKSKARHRRIWLWVFVCTWLTLFLTVIGISIPEAGSWDFAFLHWSWEVSDPVALERWKTVLRWCVRLFSAAVIVFTLVQVVMAGQSRWIRYRAATEWLKTISMRYRCGLRPFDGDARDELKRQIQMIRDVAEGYSRDEYHERFRMGYLSILFWKPDDILQDYDDATREGVDQRYLTESDSQEAELAVLNGRLLNQRKWFFDKAKQLGWDFVGFQAAITILSGASIAATLTAGRIVFGVAFTATAINFALMGWRDFLDCHALFLRYAGMAFRLRTLHEEYRSQRVPFNRESRLENVKLLAGYVEGILESEFQYWYASHRVILQHPCPDLTGEDLFRQES